MQISPPNINVTSLSVQRLQTRRYCNFQFSKKKAYLIIVCLFSSLVLKLPPLSGCSPEGGVGCMVFTVTYYIYALWRGGGHPISACYRCYTHYLLGLSRSYYFLQNCSHTNPFYDRSVTLGLSAAFTVSETTGSPPPSTDTLDKKLYSS